MSCYLESSQLAEWLCLSDVANTVTGSCNKTQAHWLSQEERDLFSAAESLISIMREFCFLTAYVIVDSRSSENGQMFSNGRDTHALALYGVLICECSPMN